MSIPLVALLLIWIALPAKAQEDRVEQLLRQMTLEEKVGQLSQSPVRLLPTGPVIDEDERANVRGVAVGSILNAYGVEQTRQLQTQVLRSSRLKIPALFAFDVIHGFGTVFPVPLAETAAWEPDLARRTARAAAVEATASGVHWALAPVVDIARDPRWGRVVEGAGEDPFLGAAMAVARIRGYRGEGPPDVSSMMTTAKHFVAYGAAEGGRDYNVAEVSERTLREVHLPPFEAAVQARTDAIMPAFSELEGVPIHSSAALLSVLLRGQWQYSGLILSDYTAVHELMVHGIARSPVDAARLAFNAGVDIEMVSKTYRQHLPALAQGGQVSMAAIDEAVRRVLKAKQRLGLFEDPYRYSDATREATRVLTPEHRALAREAGQKSIVLLKNTQGLLPLSKKQRRLLVVGSLAADAQATLGPASWPGKPEHAVTVLQGIRRAVHSGTDVTFVPGASPVSADTQGIAAAAQAAQTADAVVAVLGETAWHSGEAQSRAGLGLPGAQDALLHALLKTGKPVVIVLMNGRPLTLSADVQRAPALVEAWLLGSEMGNAVADVLFGDVNPSGKLPITFPRSEGQIPLYYAHKNTGRPPVDDGTPPSGWTSHYRDIHWTPLYPFGYGLSYTTFQYSAPRLSTHRLTADQRLVVTVTLTNTGARSGDEIVQLYLRDDVASVTRPVRQLRGFQKIHLAPGEARDVAFTLDQKDFALLDSDFLPIVEAGTFTVFVGPDSTTQNLAHFEVIDSRKLPVSGPPISPGRQD